LWDSHQIGLFIFQGALFLQHRFLEPISGLLQGRSEAKPEKNFFDALSEKNFFRLVMFRIIGSRCDCKNNLEK